MDLLGLALWGLAGAFVYGAPRLIVALSEAGSKLWSSFAEFVVALAVGPIAAAGFGDLVAGWVGWQGSAGLRALAVVIGLVANPAGPLVVQLATAWIARRFNASASAASSIKPRDSDRP